MVENASNKDQSLRKILKLKKAYRSKTERLLEYLRRPGGASLEELMKCSGWQAHSVRGFLSGTVKRKKQLELSILISDDGVRRYVLPGEMAS